MIGASSSQVLGGQLNPAQKARIIMAEAQADLQKQLWQAALGGADGHDKNGADTALGAGIFGTGGGALGLGSDCGCTHGGGLASNLLGGLLNQLPGGSDIEALKAQLGIGSTGPASQFQSLLGGEAVTDGFDPDAIGGFELNVKGLSEALGANGKYAGLLTAAAERTGLESGTLAAIIDAEAGTKSDGSWNTHARNPRSSAAGLGQFLSGTWVDLAQTKGTHLNELAAGNGWLADNGRVKGAARTQLLATRYDAGTSINAIADYSRINLDRLERQGIDTGSEARKGRVAYIAHHLGPGDAARFLKNGGLDEGRARMLLAAQIGTGKASQRIASAGSASSAHQQWLEGFVARKVDVSRYQGELQPQVVRQRYG